MVQYKLKEPVVARYLRLIPLDWNPTGRIGLRLEMYGCQYSKLEYMRILFNMKFHVVQVSMRRHKHMLSYVVQQSF